MTARKSDSDRSKYLSYLLRHKPEAAKLSLDKEGWCSIEQLLANTDFSRGELYDIVDGDAKTRYALSPDATMIRANQGHSTATVKMSYKTAVPPTILYHGTSSDVENRILKEGLKPMNRHHVHLSADLDTAKSVAGRRRGGVIVFEIDAKAMLADDHKFFISDNNVWLVHHVPPAYLKELA